MPELNWVGKAKVITHHLDVPYRVLDRQFSFDEKGQHKVDNDSPNMIIHGDNLEALKALLPQYESRIDCIYIDPPYNTGNEGWVYNDNVNDPRIKKWLGDVVGKEGEDLSRHDKWLCMMYPRLRLLQRLLAPTGAIFISIDDNEVANLRSMCDEIFGTPRFVADVAVVNNLKGRSDDKYVATAHEHLLIYRGSEFLTNGVPLPAEYVNEYKLIDNSGRYRLQGLRKRGSQAKREDRPKLFYPFSYNPDSKILRVGEPESDSEICILPRLSDGTDGRWRWGRDTAKARLDELTVQIVRGREEYDVFQKDYLVGTEERRAKPKSVWTGSEFAAETGTLELKAILGKGNFDTPKPTGIIEYCLEQIARPDALVLDSFAGSATTAHAVLKMNKEDGGNRSFILIELGDYADTVTAERVRRAIRGFSGEKTEEIVLFDQKLTLGALKKAPELLAEATKVADEAQGKYTKVSRPKVVTKVSGKTGSSSVQVVATKMHDYDVSGTGGSFSFYELGEPLLVNGNLNAAVPVEKVCEYIWYTETQTPPQLRTGEEYPFYLGTHQYTAYHFIYVPDRVTNLGRDYLASLSPEVVSDTQVIYADTCTLSAKELSALNVTFKKIPRDITRL